MPRFHVTVFTPRNLQYFSSILAGLYELSHDGLARVESKVDLEMAGDGAVVRCRVEDRAAEREASVLFDLVDGEPMASSALRHPADVIFKRSLGPLSRASAGDAAGKLHSAGLIFSARARHEPSAWPFYLASQLSVVAELARPRIPRLASELVAPVYRELQHTLAHARRERFADWEAGRDATREPFVLYQTRVLATAQRLESAAFGAHMRNIAPAKEEVNEQRVRLVQRLRDAFGPSFRGGIKPDRFAHERYESYLTVLPTERNSYRELVKHARVVVYSRGLLGAAAFRLAEYLAAGRCIVADRVSAELPSPLRDGEHLVYFDDEEHCVALCRALLDDPERARALGRNAARYYDEWVRPPVNALRMLEIASRCGRPRAGGARGRAAGADRRRS